MSWITDLVDLYDRNEHLVGIPKEIVSDNGKERTVCLLPIGHIQVNVPIQIDLNADGTFNNATVLRHEEQKTIIPTTVDSGVRSNNKSPMALDDQLKYVARDFHFYSKKSKDIDFYQKYVNQLKEYKDYLADHGPTSAYQTVSVIYKYVTEHDLLKDLVDYGIFGNQTAYSIVEKWTGKGEKPLLYQESSESLDKIYVRFNVWIKNEKPHWENPTMYKAWNSYYESKLGKGIDYISGKTNVVLTGKHMRGILPKESKAILISANDTDNYTYRGRFCDRNEVVTLGYENSQKAQLALKWLIDRQGFGIDKREYLVWGTKGEDMSVIEPKKGIFAQPLESLFQQLDNEELPDTNEQLAAKIKNAFLKGENICHLNANGNVYIMELDAPVQGRIDIVYYQSLAVQSYIDKLTHWYSKTAIYVSDKNGYMNPNFSLRRLADFRNGKHAKNDLIKNTVSSLAQTILGTQKVSWSILNGLYNRAIRPMSFNDPHEKFITWSNTMRGTAKLFRTVYPEFGPVLDKQIKDRNYLFGRLLAIADIAENESKKEKQKGYLTNAQRYMTTFAQQPLTVWKTIYLKLMPYLIKMGKDESKNYIVNRTQREISEISILLQGDVQKLDQPLNGSFLIGYVHQKADWYHKRDHEEKQINFNMFSMDNTDTERSYLFGRALALADLAESEVMGNDNGRATNAQKYLSSFAQRPLTTWSIIFSNLQPYLTHNQYAFRFKRSLDRIFNLMPSDEESMKHHNDPLNGRFIIGYYQQRNAWFRKEKIEDTKAISLNQQTNSRDYLYGRLLAFADVLENNVLNSHEIKRQTNAMNYLKAFKQQPLTTWKIIRLRIAPYIKNSRYGSTIVYYINEIEKGLSDSNAPLNGEFLVGYSQQRYAWYYKKENN